MKTNQAQNETLNDLLHHICHVNVLFTNGLLRKLQRFHAYKEIDILTGTPKFSGVAAKCALAFKDQSKISLNQDF
jgi:hypothetical protein